MDSLRVQWLYHASIQAGLCTDLLATVLLWAPDEHFTNRVVVDLSIVSYQWLFGT